MAQGNRARRLKHADSCCGSEGGALRPFDRTLLFRNKGPANPAGDLGPVIVPKLFRRRSTFGIAQTATIAGPGPFKNYPQAEPDACFETRDFLNAGHSAPLRPDGSTSL